MELTALDRQALREIYERHAVADFPPNERKPLSAMEGLAEAGRYDTFGLYKDGALLAYAFLCGNEARTCVMLDYLAVCRGGRGRGVGATMLKLLQEHYRDYPCMVAEAESPGEDAAPEENKLRRRRVQFYLRAGFRETGYRVLLFGVWYVLLYTGQRETKAVCEAHRNIYREQAALWGRKLAPIPYEKS